jgi:acyl-CoA synthetase (AMP-forming)/AMP-acid ligase II
MGAAAQTLSLADVTIEGFWTVGKLLRLHAAAAPDRAAVVMDSLEAVTYRELDRLADRVAAALQRDGVAAGDAIAVCGAASIPYVALFLGAVRAGVAAAPLSPSASAEALTGMVADSGAKLLFLDASVNGVALPPDVGVVALGGAGHAPSFEAWLAPEGASPQPVEIGPDHPFNIIYSSGTTGAPKGIVQSHYMRWRQIIGLGAVGYGPDAVALISTPLYSNTTLVSLIPTLAGGGTAAIMRKFDVGRYLAWAEELRMTHTMLVPVQYRRLLDHPEFDRHDLSSTRLKFCTSAPFSSALKAETLARWPGGLIEFFGMTEGGGVCILQAHLNPDKLHTVGRPAPDHDIRLIDEDGRELGPGEMGEIVGRSPSMMNGYHGRPDKTAEATWTSPEGLSFIRTGDVGRFDEDGFLTLMDRKKDLIISGGFNIYPSDLEAALAQRPAVKEAAVIGVPSREWGETPVAFVVLKPGVEDEAEAIRAFANERLGRMQRLAEVRVVADLPRSPIGKVLKRELRDGWTAAALEAR